MAFNVLVYEAELTDHHTTPPIALTTVDPTAGILRHLVLVALTGIALILTWRLASPFLSPFTWALALAIALSPIQKWLAGKMPPSLAALLTVTLVILIVAVPLTLLAQALFQESLRAEALLRRSYHSGAWTELAANHYWLDQILDWANRQLDLSNITQQLAAMIAGFVAPALATSLRAVSQAGIALLALFFFLRDQDSILTAIGRFLPLRPSEIDLLARRILTAVQSAVYGRLLIGLLQGILGGIIFAVVGLPSPVFWGAVMSVLSTIPMLGSFVVWIPAAAILLVGGDWPKALIVTIWGLAVINPTDNLLYPVLVGARLGLHPLVLFIAFVGGLIGFGPAGLILGPCIIAFAVGIAEVWQSRNTSETGTTLNALN